MEVVVIWHIQRVGARHPAWGLPCPGRLLHHGLPCPPALLAHTITTCTFDLPKIWVAPPLSVCMDHSPHAAVHSANDPTNSVLWDRQSHRPCPSAVVYPCFSSTIKDVWLPNTFSQPQQSDGISQGHLGGRVTRRMVCRTMHQDLAAWRLPCPTQRSPTQRGHFPDPHSVWRK